MTEKIGKGDARGAFWEKPLDQLTRVEWEQLCDGCGRCCLVKLEDEDTGTIHHAAVACRLLDQHSCRCGDYAGRKKIVPDCVRLTLKKLETIRWLPPTCAYLLRFQGKPLPPWHPLISGDPDSVHKAGVSVRDRVEASETEVEEDDMPDFIRLWPKRWPRGAGLAPQPASVPAQGASGGGEAVRSPERKREDADSRRPTD
jgi:uncharacterized cysteine cluster protein YcgN (CxxCxxCC family)